MPQFNSESPKPLPRHSVFMRYIVTAEAGMRWQDSGGTRRSNLGIWLLYF